MGELFIHDLKPYFHENGCNVFVETGTGEGTGLEYALRYPFEKLYSIEYMAQLWEHCTERFKDTRLQILNTDSLTGLEKILKEVAHL